jgi:hypothetical protein
MNHLGDTRPQHGMSREECDELVRDLAWSGCLALSAGVYYPHAASRAQLTRTGARHVDHLASPQGHRADSWASRPLTEVGHDQERRLVLGHTGERLLVDHDGCLGCLRGPIG